MLLSALPLLHGHRHRCLFFLLFLYFAQNSVLFIAKELAFATLFIVTLAHLLANDVLFDVLAVLLLHTRVGKREVISQVIFVTICRAIASIIRLRIRLGVAAVERLISDLRLELFVRFGLLHRQCLLILLLLLLLLVITAIIRAVIAVIFVSCGGFGR